MFIIRQLEHLISREAPVRVKEKRVCRENNATSDLDRFYAVQMLLMHCDPAWIFSYPWTRRIEGS
ncbi:predicted protein [Sclerotinia sclerotiorum 1980 UF-70]|uniref:Uncharacterized protein n=1 Tax=Sclerotinia sclerotiorum (strain ATCC 18683 / 1980 / Ss-1) TaxID=665079 RepID=A7ESD7_SCLS1|nr:predicted protein [Sclerotinia sclerotiorum 1980 UF-70]EDN92379.1 predicted protein [Sclerotinia sclerotiorum 1980 UF-70]